jgi:hypothetical protein
MTDEERLEESTEEVEAHKKRALADEPAAEDDSDDDDVEAHKKRALADEPAAEDDGDDDVEAHRRRA